MVSTRILLLVSMLFVGSFAALDDACNSDTDCDVEFSTCDHLYDTCDQGVCICRGSYYRNGAACREKLAIGETCTDTDDCNAAVIGTRCSGQDGDVDRVCECELSTEEEDHLYDHDGQQYCCYLMGQECDELGEDTQCLSHQLDSNAGICDGTCTCNVGYDSIEEECVYSTHGQSCAGDLVCDDSKDLTCNDDDKCACNNNFEFNDEFQYCMRTNVELVGSGADCDNTPTVAESSHCNSIDLVCDVCPGSTSTQEQCQQISGASGVAVSSVMCLMILCLSKLFA